MTKKLICLGLFFLLSGCRQIDLHHNLQEIEADEIMVLLNQKGIDAKKVKEVSGQDISWKVSVRETDLSRARQQLITNHLPRKRELGLSGVYKEKGLIPTPDEQKARFLLALKGEIINSLQKIPGVIDADIVLNVPTEGEFSELDPVKKKPTASVVIKTRNDPIVAQTVTDGKVQRFVANTIPNLDPNDVTVIISRGDIAEASFGEMPGAMENAPSAGPSGASDLVTLAGVRIDAQSTGRFKAYIIGLLLLLVGVSSFLLFNIGRLNRLRLKVQTGIVPQARPAGYLEQPQANQGAIEGTFDVGARDRQ